jgi:hypothetical protein
MDSGSRGSRVENSSWRAAEHIIKEIPRFPNSTEWQRRGPHPHWGTRLTLNAVSGPSLFHHQFDKEERGYRP